MSLKRTLRPAASGAVLVSVLGVSLATSASAAPAKSSSPAKEQCVAAHEEAQSLRVQKKLHAARVKYVVCARVECPLVLRKECTEQIGAMDAVAPTITADARGDSGASDADVRVSLDAQLVAERLTGAAIPIEPGEHVLRFERARDGKTLEERLLVVEGEKNRKVVADFRAGSGRTSPPSGERTGGEKQGASEKPAFARIPVLAWVAGGVAVAGAGSFAFFSLSGRDAEGDLAKQCAPSCTEDAVSPVKRDYLLADVSLVVTVVAAAAAVVLALPSFNVTKTASTTSAPPWMPVVRVKR
jgi:hypothetical protein